MVYKVIIKFKVGKDLIIDCADDYLTSLKQDIMDKETEFLDLEDCIVRKDNIEKVDIKKVSEN